jgi:hypothetical protein
MERIQEKITILAKLINKIEKLTDVEISIDVAKTVDMNEENEEYFYTLFLVDNGNSLTLLKEVSYETAYHYLKAILIGYEYALEKMLRTICVN